MKALYPGTFDPITYGHLDVAKRAAGMFDEVVIAVSNHGRKNTMFTLQERLSFVQHAIADTPNIKAIPFDNLTVDCAVEQNAKAVIRGLRVTSDFEYEFTMAKFMAEQNHDIQPVYLMADAKLTHISSTMVKEIASLGGDIARYVPECVQHSLGEKFADAAQGGESIAS